MLMLIIEKCGAEDGNHGEVVQCGVRSYQERCLPGTSQGPAFGRLFLHPHCDWNAVEDKLIKKDIETVQHTVSKSEIV